MPYLYPRQEAYDTPSSVCGIFLSGGVSEIGWLHAGLILEFSREIIRGFEIEAVGYFLDALIGGRQQFLGSLQFQSLLIECRSEAGIFLEELAERRIADAQFLC